MSINDVFTIKEAAELYGIKDQSSLRYRFIRGVSFKEGIDCRKSGGTWIVTKEAMDREYGEH